MKNSRGMNRRQFMLTSLAATAGLAANVSGFSQGVQAKKSNMREKKLRKLLNL
ncbi:MAG: hypothetical protein NTV31_15730 [Bacteroidia bacterium]|nr:hypothetical protein [Bacteroidia bacterium]